MRYIESGTYYADALVVNIERYIFRGSKRGGCGGAWLRMDPNVETLACICWLMAVSSHGWSVDEEQCSARRLQRVEGRRMNPALHSGDNKSRAVITRFGSA
jgi:hypothetical protein